MFRAITKGFTEFLKRRSSVEMTHLPDSTTAIRNTVGQNSSSAQPNNQSASTDTSKKISNFNHSSTAKSLSRLASSTGINPSQFADAEPNKILSQDNWVRVRIWTSKTGDGQDTYAMNAVLGGGNVGHATLETGKVYASIWPEHGASSIKETYDPQFVSNPQRDMMLESMDRLKPKEPDYVFVFYSLDVKAIEEMFKQIKESKEPWTLFGHLINEKGYSCSSLTLSLLEKGGLNNLASQNIRGILSPTSNLASSPNNLVNQLLYASRVEQNKHPEIIDFKDEKANKTLSEKEPFFISIKAGKVSLIETSNNENEKLFSSFISPKPWR